MRERGLEPPHGCPYKNLNLARLPVPPLPRRFHSIRILCPAPRARQGKRRVRVFNLTKHSRPAVSHHWPAGSHSGFRAGLLLLRPLAGASLGEVPAAPRVKVRWTEPAFILLFVLLLRCF